MSKRAVATYERVEIDQLRKSIAAARQRLAELQTKYTIEKANVDNMQARLFEKLQSHYQQRDRLRLIIDYRKRFLVTILGHDGKSGSQVKQEYERAKRQSEQEYKETINNCLTKKPLTVEAEAELQKLWRKLVNICHPDRFARAPDKLETYGKLTAAINHARDTGDIVALREIAADPDGFVFRRGWAALDFRGEEDILQLKQLRESLEREISCLLSSSKELHESSEFELYKLATKSSRMFEGVVAQQAKDLDDEIVALQQEADHLSAEIERLTGQSVPEGSFA